MNNKKMWIIAGSVLIIVLIVAIIGKKTGKIGGKPLVAISTEVIEKQTIIETITANGKVQPETEVKISADVSGEIVELNVMEGDRVKQGELLLKIKPDIYLSALDRVEASLNSTKSNLANSKARLAQVKAQFKQTELSFTRNEKLYKQGAISTSEFENIQAQFAVSEAEVTAAEQSVKAAEFAVKSAEATLKEANENLQKTTIYAPVNGTVSKLNVEKGERVVGTIQMAGTEIMRIANLQLMEVKVDVNENDIVRVTHGDTALIEVDAYMDEKFKGIVTEIANSANTTGMTTDQVTNFEVKIRILQESYTHLMPENDENYYPFRPGMSATVDIQTETKYDIIAVPIQAVTTRPDSISENKAKEMETDDESREDGFVKDGEGNNTKKDDVEMKEVVFVYADGQVQVRYVKTGIQNNSYIEITEGVSLNEEVVNAPYNAISKKLKHETKVEKKDKDKLFGKK